MVARTAALIDGPVGTSPESVEDSVSVESPGTSPDAPVGVFTVTPINTNMDAGMNADLDVVVAVEVIVAPSGEAIVIDGGAWMLRASFERSGPDLTLVGPDGQHLVIRDFFAHDTPPDLMSAERGEGIVLRGSQIEALAGPPVPGAYADAADGAGQMSDAGVVELASVTEPIGRVTSADGEVTVMRADGTREVLEAGDPVFQGDIVETGETGGLGIEFVDESTFSLGNTGRMILDRFVYDPDAQEGALAFSMVEGTFSFVSGHIAKTGPEAMQISTPTATMDIRGTAGGGHIDAEGVTTATLLPEQGFVGEMVISNEAGSQAVNQPGQTVSIAGSGTPPSQPFEMTPVQMGGLFGSALGNLPNAAAAIPADVVAGAAEGLEQQVQAVAAVAAARAAVEQAEAAMAEALAGTDAAAVAAAEAAVAEAMLGLAEAELEAFVSSPAGAVATAAAEVGIEVPGTARFAAATQTVATASARAETLTAVAESSAQAAQATRTAEAAAESGEAEVSAAEAGVESGEAEAVAAEAGAGATEAETAESGTEAAEAGAGAAPTSTPAPTISVPAYTPVVAVPAPVAVASVVTAPTPVAAAPTLVFFTAEPDVTTEPVPVPVLIPPPPPLVMTPAVVSATEDGAVDGQLQATDPDGGTLTYTVVNQPGEGTVTVNADGSYSFDPGNHFQNLAAGDTRDVTFTWRVTSSTGKTGDSTATVTVTGANDAVVATPAVVQATEDAGVVDGQLQATDPDGDTLTYERVGPVPANSGSFTVDADGSYSFDPGSDFQNLAAGETEEVTFTWRAVSSDGTTDDNTATVTVTGVNDAPVAVDDALTAYQNEALSFTADDLLDNDNPVDDDPVTVSVALSNSGDGTLTGTGTTADPWEFTPTAGFTGSRTLAYTVTDSQGASDTGTVDVTVVRRTLYDDAYGGGPGNRVIDLTGNTDAAHPDIIRYEDPSAIPAANRLDNPDWSTTGDVIRGFQSSGDKMSSTPPTPMATGVTFRPTMMSPLTVSAKPPSGITWHLGYRPTR